jgi:predicted deacylase
MVAVQRLGDEFRRFAIAGEIELIPIVNQGAYRLGRRVGEDGLDLARTCPGNRSGNVTQQCAAALSARISKVDYFIDLHTGGANLQMAPLAGYMLHSDDKVLKAQRRMAEAFNLPTIWGTTAQLEGRSLSVARDHKVPAIYVEYGGGSVFNPEIVEAYVQGCINVAGNLQVIDKALPASRVERRVEDARPDSGYLQICHPAPLEGVFQLHARVGQQVQRGDLLGFITDPLSGDCCDVRAEFSGMVLMLRVAPRVHVGDGLAVVIERGSTG